MKDLNKEAFGGLFFLLLVMAALLFLPSWTLDLQEGVGLPLCSAHRRLRSLCTS